MLSSEKSSAGWTCEDLSETGCTLQTALAGKFCLRLDELEKLETNEECRHGVAEKLVGSIDWQMRGRPLVDCIVVDCGADQRRIMEGTAPSAKNPRTAGTWRLAAQPSRAPKDGLARLKSICTDCRA